MKKSFRGLLANDSQEQIRLSTNNGLTGYKIVKFQVIGINENVDYETVVQIFTKNQSTDAGGPGITDTINFTDPLLLGVAYLTDDKNVLGTVSNIIVFDNITFNQDIFITHEDTTGSQPCNYYLELEQVTLSKDEATVATLKDMRAGPDTNFGP